MIRCECGCNCCATQVFLLPDASTAEAVAGIICPNCGRRLLPRRIEPFGEADWLECKDPRVLAQGRNLRIFKRKQRLFVCGCCRLIWDRLTDPRSREAVAVAECFADGKATHSQLVSVERGARAVNDSRANFWQNAAWEVVAASNDWDLAIWRLFPQYGICTGDTQLAARATDLFRDIMGNPFRIVFVLQEWLDWNDRTVVKIAEAIYEERAFERMPILADALEEAGCAGADILDHCRQPGEHTRGCWLVDLLLGKT